MTINDFLTDWDNDSLNEADWNEQMEMAVDMYNEEYSQLEPCKNEALNISLQTVMDRIIF